MRLLAGIMVLFVTACLHAQGTAFTYQGKLNSGGYPANGGFDLTFGLFPTNTGGLPSTLTLTNLATSVSNGLFMVTLDFGPGYFDGATYWLQVGVRTNGNGSFTTLTPRQPITPAPYSIFANTASNVVGTVAAGQLVGAMPAISGANLTGLTAAQSGAVGTNQFGTGTSGGMISSNQYNYAAEQMNAASFQAPPIIWSTWGRYGDFYTSNNFNMLIPNLIYWQSVFLQTYTPAGFVVAQDDGVLSQRNASGVLTLNPTNFPGTPATWGHTVTTNGFVCGYYFEPNSTKAGGHTSAGFPDSEGTNIEFDAMNFGLWVQTWPTRRGFAKLDPHACSSIGEAVGYVQRFESTARKYATNCTLWFQSDLNFIANTTDNYAQLASALPGTIIRVFPESWGFGGGDSNTVWASWCTNQIDFTRGLQFMQHQGQWFTPDEAYDNFYYPLNHSIVLTEAITGSPMIYYGIVNINFDQNSLVTNTELLNIAYDSLWNVGQPAVNTGSPDTYEALCKPLSDGSLAVALVNRTTNRTETCSLLWTNIGLNPGGAMLVRNVDGQTNYGTFTGAFTNAIGPEGVVLLHLFPIDSPLYSQFLQINSPLTAANLTGTLPNAALPPNTVTNALATNAITPSISGGTLFVPTNLISQLVVNLSATNAARAATNTLAAPALIGTVPVTDLGNALTNTAQNLVYTGTAMPIRGRSTAWFYLTGSGAPWVGNGGSSCTNQGDWQPLPPGVYDTNSFTFSASTTSILGGSNIIVTIYTNSGFGTTAAIFSQNTFLGPLTNLAQMSTNWPLNQAPVGKGVWATVSITNNTAGNYSNCYFVNQVSHH